MRRLFLRLRFCWLVAWQLAIWPIVVLFPRDNKKIIFGAWWGNQFSDNPKYFFRYLRDLNVGFKCYWFGNECLREKVVAEPGLTFVRKGSWRAHWHVLTASWIVSAISVGSDVTDFPTYGKVKQLSFWHGTSFKGLCNIDRKVQLSSNFFRRLIQRFSVPEFRLATPLYSFCSVSYEDMRFRLPLEEPWSFMPETTIAAGTARIDYLIQNAKNVPEINRVREKIGQLLGLPSRKRWYLYMPTYRQGLSVNYSLAGSKFLDEINRLLDSQDAIFIEKQHPQVLQHNKTKGGQVGNVYVVSQEQAALDIDTQELLLACDRLVTDYSSCFCDYEVMKRPVIHFAYDYDVYKSQERKATQDIEKVGAGPVAYDEKSFLSLLSLKDEELLARKGSQADYLVSGEKGQACETFAKWVGLI